MNNETKVYTFPLTLNAFVDIPKYVFMIFSRSIGDGTKLNQTH